VNGLPRTVAVVAPSPVPLRRGGAERLWSGLVDGLLAAGVEVDLIKLPVRELTLPDLLDAYEQFALLDLSHVDAVITGKYPAWMVDHPHHVVWMLHPLRGLYDSYHPEVFEGRRLPADADLDRVSALLADGPRRSDPFEVMDRVRGVAERLGPAGVDADGPLSLPGPLARAVVQFLDRCALDGRRIQNHAAISAVVARRPDYFPPDVEVDVVPPPSSLRPGRPGELGRDLLVVSRLERIKRVDLAVEAFARVEDPAATLTVVGRGPDRERLEELASGDGRIRFVGGVDDDELRRLYATARAVVVTPEREDFGLVTVEAQQHARPVLTVTDAGGPAELVTADLDGLVVEPRPDALSAAMARLLHDDDLAGQLGRAALEAGRATNWEHTVHRLLDRSRAPSRPTGTAGGGRGRIVAVSTYPVQGWVGGGPERAEHLLGALVEDGWTVDLVDLSVDGGPQDRRELGEGFTEMTVRCSGRHHDAEARLRLLAGNVSITDIAASQLWPATPAFTRELSAALAAADGVVLVQPYLHPAVAALAPDLPFVLDAHNHEVALKRAILPDSEGGRWLLDRVVETEGHACAGARLVTVTTEGDRTSMATEHSLDPDRFAVVPNGVDTRAVPFTPLDERPANRDRVLARMGGGGSRRLALFVGSGHAPNIEAGRAVLAMAPHVPDTMFLLAGRHSRFLDQRRLPDNVRLLGPVGDDQLGDLLAAADVALNPMGTGGGSNLKLLGYFAAGVPVVSTPVGSRGLGDDARRFTTQCEIDEFPEAVRDTVAAPDERMVRAARRLVEERFDWTVIGRRFAGLVAEVLDPTGAARHG
jgi:glycosyltransferase involved in cell wall biosynthesis